jgi:hypothetical protein
MSFFELFLAFLSLEKGNFFGFGSKKLKIGLSSKKLKKAQISQPRKAQNSFLKQINSNFCI